MWPTPYAVQVREQSPSAPDDFGNETWAWAESTWHVHGIAPGAMDEPGDTNRDASVIAWTVYGPKAEGYPRSAGAEIQLHADGDWHPVDGEPKDWTSAPWVTPDMPAGVVVELRRVEG